MLRESKNREEGGEERLAWMADYLPEEAATGATRQTAYVTTRQESPLLQRAESRP